MSKPKSRIIYEYGDKTMPVRITFEKIKADTPLRKGEIDKGVMRFDYSKLKQAWLKAGKS